MWVRLYSTLNGTGGLTFNKHEINSISELFEFIKKNETLSKYGDKIQSANAFLFKKLDDYEDSPLEFSWIDIDGRAHEGVSRDAIGNAVRTIADLKIPFLVFSTQHENCYKIICHVSYLSGKSIGNEEYKQINEKFQKHIFSICKLNDYEEGSCSPTKGFCLSKNGIKKFNENEKPFNITFAYEPPVRQLSASNNNYTEIQKSEKEKFEYALKFITTDICSNFDEWTSCAMAINATFGDGGLVYFKTISAYYSGRQSPGEIDAKYKHCKNTRNVSIGTVYHLIEKAGIVIDWKPFYLKADIATSKTQSIPRVKILARKFDDLENSYYYQLHGFYSISEMEELLTEHKINISKLSFDWDKDKNTLNYVRITKNGLTQSLNQLFADKWAEFTKICTEKHFPLYQDVLTDKFSFNFTAEEMTAWLTTYPMTIFRNFEYNRSAHAITPKVNNADHFEIDRTVRSKIENLFNSSLNIQEKKFKEFKHKMDAALLTFSENFEMQQEGINIKQNNGWIDDVLIIGRKYIESHPGSSVSENTSYWMDSLKSIFTINENDYFSLVSFVMDSIKVRLHGSSQSMRVMVITGDSGIGKDSFLQGLLTGLNYQKAIKVILRGALKGVTGFSSAKEKTLKSVMYNYVSDDLSAANASTNLDTITATELPCENKGKDQKMIPKRFNSVITNNAKKVIFGKDKDPNAIARRFNCCDIKYAKGCLASDYKIFFRHYDGKFDEYWAGFFTYCFELSYFKAESDKLAIMASNYTLDNIHELIYQGNDDSRILDLFTGFYNREIEKMNVNVLEYERSLTFDTQFKNEFIKGIKGKYVLIIKSISDFWKIDNKFSADTIKKTISAHVKGAKFNSTYKDDRVSKHAAISIPCEYFTKESEPDNFEDGFAQIKTDLIENFKKYL